MEEDIDEEINAGNDDSSNDEDEVVPEPPKKQRVICDFKSLDEMVSFSLNNCIKCGFNMINLII